MSCQMHLTAWRCLMLPRLDKDKNNEDYFNNKKDMGTLRHMMIIAWVVCAALVALKWMDTKKMDRL